MSLRWFKKKEKTPQNVRKFSFRKKLTQTKFEKWLEMQSTQFGAKDEGKEKDFQGTR